MIQFVAFSMAELCSSMPTAVDPYNDTVNDREGYTMRPRFLLLKDGVRWLHGLPAGVISSVK